MTKLTPDAAVQHESKTGLDCKLVAWDRRRQWGRVERDPECGAFLLNRAEQLWRRYFTKNLRPRRKKAVTA
jgi:hypothetical protein